MAIGGFFKALGKGARAVGRGAMKGVLGFDDRDITSKFGKKPTEEGEPDGDEVNEDYSGYSRGVADLGSNDPIESDGFEAAEFGMEAPPEMAMSGMESLMGLEMPDLPGFKKKGVSKPAGGMGGGVKIEAPKTIPTAYETVTAGVTEKPMMEIPGIRSMRGSLTQDVYNLENNSGTMSMDRGKFDPKMMGPGGDIPGYGPDEMDGAAEGAIKGAETALTLSGIPGLMRGAGAAAGALGAGDKLKKAGKGLSQWMKGSPTRTELPMGKSAPGYSSSPGMRVPGAPLPKPQPGPGKGGIEEMFSKGRLDRARYSQPAGPMEKPIPGMGGVEGPMGPLPPGLRETGMEVLYNTGTKSLRRVPR